MNIHSCGVDSRKGYRKNMDRYSGSTSKATVLHIRAVASRHKKVEVAKPMQNHGLFPQPLVLRVVHKAQGAGGGRQLRVIRTPPSVY